MSEAFLIPPSGVTMYYLDGTQEEATSLIYVGIDPELLTNVWEALDPHPDRPLDRLTVQVLPAHSTVRVHR